MDVKQLLATVAMVVAAGMAYAEKPMTWVVPDAGFKSSMTRAEVRNDLRSGDRRAWHQRDGEETFYSATSPGQSRKDIRSEMARTAHAQHLVNVNGLYFGD